MTPHRRFRDRLAILAADEVVPRVLGEGPWLRTYGRFTPTEPAYATLVYRQPQRLVRVDVSDHEREDAVPAGALGWLRIEPFPRDPGLPTLAAALRDLDGATVVRYRPGRRCTLRLGGRFVKVFPDGRGERLHAEAEALWDAAGRGELAFGVARPIGFAPDTLAVAQERLPGSPLAAVLARDGAGLAERLGAAAASLTRSGVRPRTTLDAAVQLRRADRVAERLRVAVPATAGPLDRLLGRLRSGLAGADARAARPVHGSLHVPQWLVDGGRIGLVDFDRHGLGDPELDAATMAASLEHDAERPDLVEPFLAAYAEVAGRLRPELVRAYRAARGLAKALSAARAIRPGGDERALRRLESALAALEEGVA